MTEGSAHRTTIAVRTVFRCVASRNRSRKTTVAKHQLKRFGLAPTPRGAPRLGAEAGDAKHREPFGKNLRLTVIFRAPFSVQPSRRDGRPVASPRDGSATFASLICARAGDGPKNRSARRSLAARPAKAGVGSATGGNCPYAGRAVPPGTRYYPFGRENSLWPRAWENHSR